MDKFFLKIVSAMILIPWAATVYSQGLGAEDASQLELVEPAEDPSPALEGQAPSPDLDDYGDVDVESVLEAQDVFSTGAILDLGIDEYEPGSSLELRGAASASARVQQEVDRLIREAAFQGRVGNLTGSLEIYDAIIQMDPGNDFARFNKGTILIQLQRYHEALDVLNQVLDSNPNNYMVRNNIAWVYATADDISVRNGNKALSYARYALMLAPSDHHVWNTLSQAYFVSARYERALRAAEIAVQLAASRGEPAERMRSLQEQLQKCRQAVSTMSILE